MVGIVARSPREKAATLLDSTKFAIEIPSKLQNLRQLNENWFQDDPVLISEFLPNLIDLQTDGFGPVRKFVTRMIGEIGLRHVENLPEIVPVLMLILQDSTPAVARQAITCGIESFRFTLEKVALQGLYSSELDESLEASWAWMLKFKDKIYSIAFQPGSDSLRLPSLKFVEAFILLYTSDPNGSSEPPSHQIFEGRRVDFNASWLRGGHPLLKVGEMSIEASQSLGLLLDQLRSPKVKSLSSLMIVVLVNSLAAIAMKRPGFYGRILPVLLGLDPSQSTIKGVHVNATHYTLKKAFLSCLKCTHPSAVPWRQRLTDALKELQSGGVVGSDLQHGGHINGRSGEGKVVPIIKEENMQEEKPSIKAQDPVQNLVGKKRPAIQIIRDPCEDENGSGKRTRVSSEVPDESPKVSKNEQTSSQDDNTSIAMTSSKGHIDSGPVQQLIAMFRALVAQGEKAVGPLEILISSISADLLTDVVMANMQNLPPNFSKVEGEDDSLKEMGKIGNGAEVEHSLNLLADVFSRAISFPQIASLSASQQSVPDDLMKNQDIDGNVATVAESDQGDDNSLLPAGLPVSSSVQSELDKVSPAFASDILGAEDLESGIPGLESVAHSEVLPEPPVASPLVPTDSEEAIEEQAIEEQGKNLVRMLPVHILPSMSNDRSEELSSKSVATDANSIISSTATSVGLSQLILPKMAAPVVDLTEKQRDDLQMVAFTRIIDAYKQIAVAGGSQDRVSLLAYLGVEFCSDLDPWKLLQKHILSDYITHEGQEFTLRVLYRLFGESEAEHDFFSSASAKNVYETFALKVAEVLRDSFPASDKSLSKLLVELPYLPKSIFTLLENLCCPESGEEKKESLGGDRVTQGLSATWSLILARPPIREACLNIALKSAVHPLEEVRMKAIRLVANKLYPIASIAQHIEDFAKETLLSVVNAVQTIVETETEVKIEADKESHLETPLNELAPLGTNSTIPNQSPDTRDPTLSESTTSFSEAQRCMSLYFALCTKKHSLFREIFILYRETSASVKQAVHRHIPVLVRTIGSSPEILEIISDPPAGSEELLMQVLNTLTEGTIPSPGLIHAIRKSYGSNMKNAEILIPILPFLPTNEILSSFPHIVSLPMDKFQAALTRVLQMSTPSGPVLTPAEVLIAIHGIDPERDGIPLKKVTDACNACFEQRQIFTQQVLAKVLNQLVEQIPLPLLFMRTVLQAIGAFPPLVGYIMEILSRLVSKQIWKYPKQWVGFLKCAQLTKPQSFNVLLQLPPAQLENALNRIATLKAPLVSHANQPHIKSSLPRSVLAVLGIATESQAQSSQAQTSPPQTPQSQTSLPQTAQSQTSLPQTTQSQTSLPQTTQSQTSPAQSGDTSNIDKEQVSEATKESSSVIS